MNASDLAPPRPKSKWLRRFKILGVFMLIIAGGVAVLPTLASMQTFKPRIERGLTEALGAPVKVRSYSVGWLSGATVDGLEIGQPAGFTGDQPLLTLDRAQLRVSWLKAMTGTFDVGGEVHGVRLLVLQNKDGTLNVQKLGGAGVSPSIEIDHGDAPDSKGEEASAAEGFLRNLRADLALRDVAIDVVHADKGTLESIRKLNATVDKRLGSTDFDVKVDAELAGPDASKPPGKLQIDADVDATLQRPIDVQITSAGFDFARYRPLVDSMLGAGSLSALAGVLDGTIKARIENLNTVFVQGALTIDKPHFEGTLLQGMNVQAAKWVINPNVELTMDKASAVPQADLDGFSVDLGLLKVTGVGAASASALFAGAQAMALDFDLDLQALGKLGGPIPAMLGEQVGRVVGRAALKMPAGGFEFDDVMQFIVDSVQVDAKVSLPQLAFGTATKILGVELPVAIKDGALRASLTPGATLNGGALTLTAGVDLKQATWPASLDLGVQETALIGDALHALQYAVPLFAGLAQQAGAELGGRGTLSMSFTGPGNKGAAETWLAWLNHWSGGGKVALADGNVRPAAAFASLMQFADPESQGMLSFKDLATDFTLREGGVETALTKLDIKGKSLGLSGRTMLDGTMDHKLDLTALLRGHKDGEKVLQYLQGKAIEGAVKGTLWSPKVAMPDVQSLFTEALKNAAQQELKKGAENLLQKGLEELFKRKK